MASVNQRPIRRSDGLNPRFIIDDDPNVRRAIIDSMPREQLIEAIVMHMRYVNASTSNFARIQERSYHRAYYHERRKRKVSKQ